jgi:hypothetical protein
MIIRDGNEARHRAAYAHSSRLASGAAAIGMVVIVSLFIWFAKFL